ncbi:hypothetical protein K402DRAFT_368427 [Aulographum hederae CBS 113979]|uniref:Carboxymuconolactone decarboxylase-like domain-containing protein n=1 Tax=Aulographum hederae CBS 113979 TaxID=1176131 RepID=A0A6G1HF60_9PEZI|nr:hypothetical protein K402DRAFT_368427 [Aulographum hederae CBS 113979]
MRLPYTPDAPTFSNPDHQAFVQRLLASRGKYGFSPLDKTLLHSPPLARGFLSFFTTLRSQTSLSLDVWELAVCRVAALNGAAFEWMHHAPLLKRTGMSAEAIEVVRSSPAGVVGGSNGLGGGAERFWRVMRYVDAMTKEVQVEDDVFEGIRKEFNEREIVDLTMTIAGYNAVSRFLVALDVAELGKVEVGKAKL